MADQRRRRAVEEQVGEVGDHRASHLRLGDQRLVDEEPSLGLMPHDSAFFEAREDRGDGGLRELALRRQRLLHFEHRGFAAFPEDADDGELEIGEADG